MGRRRHYIATIHSIIYPDPFFINMLLFYVQLKHKGMRSFTIILVAISCFISLNVAFAKTTENSILLPNNFKVYVGANGVVNHPIEGYQETILPTINAYKGKRGCYVACYSSNASTGVYNAGGNIYVEGQVRVPGHYKGRECVPSTHYKNINAQVCMANLPSCQKGSCWTGGDTGGWLGIQ